MEEKQYKKIDIGYYIESVVGLCARFINEDERYQPLPPHKIMQLEDSDEKENRLIHILSFRKIKKYIKGLQ